jgi:hypothetical protein
LCFTLLNAMSLLKYSYILDNEDNLSVFIFRLGFFNSRINEGSLYDLVTGLELPLQNILKTTFISKLF